MTTPTDAAVADVGGFLLTQELPADPRRPDTPGAALTWTEHPRRGRPYQRSGRVLSPAPRAGAVWVQPAERRPGEGAAVVVDGVAGAADQVRPRRFVGVVTDVLSTARWQQVEVLPRLWLRTDVHAWTHPGTRRVRARDAPHLHARPRCRGELPGPDWTLFERGRPVKLPASFHVRFRVRSWVHPLSARPVLDVEPVPACGICVEEPPATLYQPLAR